MKKYLIGVIFVIAAMGTGCNRPEGDSGLPQTKAEKLEKSKEELEKLTLQFNIKVQEGLNAVRLDVAKRCADRGWIPEVVNGNVTCKPLPPLKGEKE